jgi:restriction endonuclease S subunit
VAVLASVRNIPNLKKHRFYNLTLNVGANMLAILLNYRNLVFKKMKLGNIANVQTGYAFRSRLEHEPSGDIAVIQMKDIDDSSLLHTDGTLKVSLPAGKSHHFVREGDLVFRSRGRSNSVAKVGANIGEAVVAAPMLLIRPHNVVPAYLHWFINLPTTQANLAARAEGTSVRMISKEAIQDLDVPLPSKAQQERIIEIASFAQREQALMKDIAVRRKRFTEALLTRFAKNPR